MYQTVLRKFVPYCKIMFISRLAEKVDTLFILLFVFRNRIQVKLFTLVAKEKEA